jgi:hypothetical protein
MKKNLGNIDRIVRIILAIAFSVAYFTKAVEGTLGYVLLGLGAIFLLTSIINFCPLYTIFGINTCKK